MFPILAAFMLWLFATGKYADYIALISTSSGTPAAGASGTATPTAAATSNTAPASSATGTGGSSSGVASAFSSFLNMFQSGSENTGASSTSTPDDLISGFTG